jgi:hypothetical protein
MIPSRVKINIFDGFSDAKGAIFFSECFIFLEAF